MTQINSNNEKMPNKHINPTHFSMAEIVFRFTITQFQPLKNAQVM